ncbi:MFS transporter [Cohnella silvisoli]|uniref:MFS transporter n=1 Tax=Cohnella silvisoli TaxID=2873699 RepID=A0ABV1KS31_9BACL|nr:MFS transporter [Cohnella silvisoli]MCD9022583.1 MFS transporter [Cohnella silvisoli]
MNGIINDRMSNPRKLLMVAVLVAPVIGVGFYFTENIAAITALSLLFAWFQSSPVPLADSIAVEMGSRDGFSFGSVRLWGALSYSLGAFATGFLYGKYGYENIFLYYLAISLLVFVLLFWFPKTKPIHHKITIFEQTKEVFENKPFMLFLGISLVMVMSVSTNFTFLPIYYKEMDFDKGLLGSAFAIAAIIEVPMFWVAAKLSRTIGRFNLLCLSAAIYGTRCLVLFLVHDVYLTLGLQLLDGISFAFAAGTFVGVVQSYASEKTKATFQTIFAAVTWGLGGIIGNAAGGVIVDHMGTPFLYFVLFGLSVTASALFALMQRFQAQRDVGFW